ncbi:hypothetical protein D1001_03385 [Riemerella anatipestifer]|nr:hypothetical protein [Riemerella anatipestifer]
MGQELEYRVVPMDINILKLEITNNSKKDIEILLDINNLIISDTDGFINNYEMFLSNKIFIKDKKYHVPFSRITPIYPFEDNFGQDGELSLQDYISNNIIKIKTGKRINIIYNLNERSNVGKGKELRKVCTQMKYYGKDISQFIKKIDKQKDLKSFYRKNISSNRFCFYTYMDELSFPQKVGY